MTKKAGEGLTVNTRMVFLEMLSLTYTSNTLKRKKPSIANSMPNYWTRSKKNLKKKRQI